MSADRLIGAGILLANNPYGYRVNINHPRVAELYERYKRWKGIAHTTPMSDNERTEFETYILAKLGVDTGKPDLHEVIEQHDP